MKNLLAINTKRQGFTVVELIVVIVIIAILATITLVSYGVVRDRAKATALMNEITKVEDGLQLLASDQFTTEWWRDNEFTGSGNPNFDQIISAAGTRPLAAAFKKYIPETPKVSGMNLTWTYDNDKDSLDPSICPQSNWISVVLVITPVDEALVKIIDEKIDDGVTNCGRITVNGSGLQYQLSFNQKI